MNQTSPLIFSLFILQNRAIGSIIVSLRPAGNHFKFFKWEQDRTHGNPYSLRWESANNSRDQIIPQAKKKKKDLASGQYQYLCRQLTKRQAGPDSSVAQPFVNKGLVYKVTHCTALESTLVSQSIR